MADVRTRTFRDCFGAWPRLAITAFVGIWPASFLRGAEPPTLSPIYVTGSQLPQSAATVSQSIIVLPEAQANARAPALLPELLRGVASIYVDQGGAPGGFSSLYMRGADPSHTLVLIDGVRVTDPTNSRGGGMDLSLIDPRTIARVEILPGASSAIYGAEGMAGVVNIVTREPRQSGFRIGAGIGGNGYRTVHVSGALKGEAVALQAEESRTFELSVSSSSTLSAADPLGYRVSLFRSRYQIWSISRRVRPRAS